MYNVHCTIIMYKVHTYQLQIVSMMYRCSIITIPVYKLTLMHIQATYRLTLYVVTGKRKEMGYKHQELVKILQENPHSDSIKKNAIEKSVRYNLHQINQPT